MIVYVTDGAWGTGTGSPLPAATIDANFWDVSQRLTTLETDPVPPVGISNIQVIGTQMVITLTNGATFGPFTLPTAFMRWRGEYIPGAPYIELDLVTVVGYGLFLVLQNHDAPDPFDPDYTISGYPVYQKLFGDDPYRYDFGVFLPGKPGLGISDGKRLYSHLAKTDVYFLENLGDSEFLLETAPASNLVFPIRKNNAVIGSVEFEAGMITSTIDCPALQLADGDRISLMKPTAVDVAALELTGTFVGRRGTLP